MVSAFRDLFVHNKNIIIPYKRNPLFSTLSATSHGTKRGEISRIRDGLAARALLCPVVIKGHSWLATSSERNMWR